MATKFFNLNFPKYNIYEWLIVVAVSILVIYIVFFIGFIFVTAFPIFQKEGIGFIINGTWNYDTGEYGILMFIAGTFAITGLTMIFACPISIMVAIFLGQYAPAYVRSILRPLIELLVGIPSVVYGLFGFYFLSGIFARSIYPPIDQYLGFIPLFNYLVPGNGETVLLASIVLTVMVMPTIIVLSQDAIISVPKEHIEASLSLGATKWETIKKIVLPGAMSGIMAGILFGTMRAMGETMAVIMLTGNSPHIPGSILDMCYAMTSKIVNDSGENMGFPESQHALFGIAAVLFIIEIGLVLISRSIVRKKKWF
jgi:phosphate transport system permease protein